MGPTVYHLAGKPYAAVIPPSYSGANITIAVTFSITVIWQQIREAERVDERQARLWKNDGRSCLKALA